MLPSGRSSGEEAGEAPCIIAVIIIIITIIGTISQMRGAKIELCLFPSGWLTVTSSSFIHCAHHLPTGQRRPERQATVGLPPRNRGRRGAAPCSTVSMPPFCHSVRTARRQPVTGPCLDVKQLIDSQRSDCAESVTKQTCAGHVFDLVQWH